MSPTFVRFKAFTSYMFCFAEDFEPRILNRWPYAKIIHLTTWFLWTFIILNTITGQLPAVFSFNTPQRLPFDDIPSFLASNYSIYGTPTSIDMLKVRSSNLEQPCQELSNYKFSNVQMYRCASVQSITFLQ